MFEDLSDELVKIARLVEADVDPEIIGKKENTGPNIENRLKNRGRFNVMLQESKKPQAAPEQPKETGSRTPETKGYGGGMNNLMFLGSADPLAQEVSKIAEALRAEGIVKSNKADKKADFDAASLGRRKNSGEGVENKLNENFDWLADFQRQQRAPEQG